MSFDGKAYNSGGKIIREQESKYYTDLFMKVSTNFMLTQMSTKAGIQTFG